MEKASAISIIGMGLIGSCIARQLINAGYENVTVCRHADLELLNQSDVIQYFERHRPEYVFFCAVKAITDFEDGSVGDGDELYANMMMQSHVAEAARLTRVKRIIFLGSAMLYPWNLEKGNTPFVESDLERFNLPGFKRPMQASVISKLVGLKLCQYYREQYSLDAVYCLPVHIYGGFKERRNLYFLERIVMDICQAKATGKQELMLDVFGEGLAPKQFLHVEDCASAIICVMNQYGLDECPVNICGDEITCWKAIVEEVCRVTAYTGKILFNVQRKENMTSRICSAERLKDIGWSQQISMPDGIQLLCNEYMESMKDGE